MRGVETEEDEGSKGNRKRQKKNKRILEIWTETEGRHKALDE